MFNNVPHLYLYMGAMNPIQSTSLSGLQKIFFVCYPDFLELICLTKCGIKMQQNCVNCKILVFIPHVCACSDVIPLLNNEMFVTWNEPEIGEMG